MSVKDAWAANAEQLASITRNLLIVDQHQWFRFRPIAERKHGLATEITGNLNDWTLARHFRGEKAEDLIAVPGSAFIPTYHQIPTWGWIAFEIPSTSELTSAAPLDIAQRLGDELRSRGFAFLLEDYGESGEYHVWIPLRRASDSDLQNARGFPGREFVSEILETLDSPFLASSGILPLPGRHHSMEGWSRFWDGQRWLEGEKAIAHYLNFEPGPLPFPNNTNR